jgi:hypothetical protein
MTTQHTPGPWTFNLTTGVIRSISEEFPNCRQPVICDLRRWPSGDTTYIDSANAHLIAAAPELLEALQAALEALRGSAGFDEINNAKKQVKAAIAKATSTT